MFTVIFELFPHDEDGADAYFNYVKVLKPKLVENIEGFVENIRYRSLTRPGWFLSVSDWRDEKALVRWRTFAAHAGISAKGRKDIFADYHLRVGQVTSDTDIPVGYRLEEQRLDVTEVGEGTAVTLSSPLKRFQPGALEDSAARGTAKALGLDMDAVGLIAWDVFDAVFAPGNPILLQTWRDNESAGVAARSVARGIRHREIRIVRDYGMFDRRESPVFYPQIVRK
jgi:heme-degrading monooxygenase HmoA